MTAERKNLDQKMAKLNDNLAQTSVRFLELQEKYSTLESSLASESTIQNKSNRFDNERRDIDREFSQVGLWARFSINIAHDNFSVLKWT